MKKVFTLVLTLLLCFSFSVPASASVVSAAVAQPYYEKANDVTSMIAISGTAATCKSIVRGYPAVVSITVDQYLEKQGFLWIWGTYDNTTWTKTVYSSALTMSNTKTGLPNGKYRLKTVFTLTDKYGETETITVYSNEVNVS